MSDIGNDKALRDRDNLLAALMNLTEDVYNAEGFCRLCGRGGDEPGKHHHMCYVPTALAAIDIALGYTDDLPRIAERKYWVAVS